MYAVVALSGGPVTDLAAAAGRFGPVVVAVVGLLWPPRLHGRVPHLTLAWIAIICLMVLLPVVLERLQIGPWAGTAIGGGWAAAYAQQIALALTSLFSGVGLASRASQVPLTDARRVTYGALMGLALLGVTAVVSALGAGGSPVEAAGEPVRSGEAACAAEPGLPETAVVRVDAQRVLGDAIAGEAALRGVRAGSDVRWEGDASGIAGSPPASVTVRAIQVGARRWVGNEDAGWRTASPAPAGSELDAAVVASLNVQQRVTAEDLGAAEVAGLPARRCRSYVDGTAMLRAFEPLAWLSGQTDAADEAVLAAWRGDLDWWLAADGQLIAAEVRIGGQPPPGWETRELEARLEARLEVTERGAAQQIEPPPSAEVLP